VSLGVGEEAPAGGLQGRLLADAVKYIEQGTPLSAGVTDIVRHDQGDAFGSGEIGEKAPEALFLGVEVALEIDPEPSGKEGSQTLEDRPHRLGPLARSGRERALWASGQTEKSASVGFEVAPGDPSFALGSPEFCLGQKAAEVAVSLSTLDQDVKHRLVSTGSVERQMGADEGPKAETSRCLEEAGRSVDAVAIAEREGFVAEAGCLFGELLRERSGSEETECALAAKFPVVRHRPEGDQS
jgi:hypothetical protein